MIDISKLRDVLIAINAIINDGDIAEVKKERIGIVDAEPVKHENWAMCAKGILRCTGCSKTGKRTRFCPNCGSIMDNEEI